MKFFSLSVSIFLSFLILILAFQNLGAKTNYFLLLFASVDTVSPFFLILAISFLGAITGIFYTLTVLDFLHQKKEDDVGEDNM